MQAPSLAPPASPAHTDPTPAHLVKMIDLLPCPYEEEVRGGAQNNSGWAVLFVKKHKALQPFMDTCMLLPLLLSCSLSLIDLNLPAKKQFFRLVTVVSYHSWTSEFIISQNDMVDSVKLWPFKVSNIFMYRGFLIGNMQSLSNWNIYNRNRLMSCFRHCTMTLKASFVLAWPVELREMNFK